MRASEDISARDNIIQLLVFEEINIKIYWCVKGDFDRHEGDVDRREAWIYITFHTPINLDIGLFKHQLLFLLLFCDKRLVDIGIKDKNSQWLVCSSKLLKEKKKRVKGTWN